MNELNFSNFYDNVNQPIQVVDETGMIVYVNPAFLNTWKCKVDEIQRYSIFNDFELKKIGFIQVIKAVLNNNNSIEFFNYKDSIFSGSAFPFLKTNIFVVNYFDNNYVVLIHNDITESILLQEELKKARQSFVEEERLRNNFLNTVSHELRTPLNILVSYSSILKDALAAKLNEDELILLESLIRGSNRLHHSIAQMLEFVQIATDNYKMRPETFNLNDVIKSSLEKVSFDAKRKNIQLKAIFKETPIIVEADKECLSGAVFNLLENAVKFTNQGFVEVEVGNLPNSKQVLCKIKDSGVGISVEYIDNLFQAFSQEELGYGRSYEGNGLGLAITKKYIEKLGGSIIADSIKGVGTTFSFTLPYKHLGTRNSKTIDEIPGFISTYVEGISLQ